jgi:hypothetical protein
MVTAEPPGLALASTGVSANVRLMAAFSLAASPLNESFRRASAAWPRWRTLARRPRDSAEPDGHTVRRIDRHGGRGERPDATPQIRLKFTGNSSFTW